MGTLLKLAKKPAPSAGTVLRAALLAYTDTQLLASSLIGYARHLGASLDLFEGEFDQIEMLVADPNSELYAFQPSFVIVFLAAERIAAKYGQYSIAERMAAASEFGRRTERLHGQLSSRGIETLFFNLADPGDGVFGNFGNKVTWSLRNQIRECNLELARLARTASDFHVFDLAAVQASIGRDALFDPKLYFTAKFALKPEVLPLVAREIVKMMSARKGSFVKCVILDLDNTLWGGVIADDGLDRIQIGDLGLGPAFSAFQSWLKQLRDRGIVLTVCSKNDAQNAKEPFEKHPDMLLRLDDIAVFIANWQDKATNIRHIKSIVDVDYGAMVFLDDNPAERALVRESFPTMIVPELPEDPSEYVSYLQGLNLFETGNYTAQDALRTRDYQQEEKRHAEREKFVDLADFLKSLAMRGAVGPFLPFNYPRVAQLTQRSNQFNLRTMRYSESQIEEFAKSPNHVTLAVELKDRFGDNGLISVVILEVQQDALLVDTWLMSCRVLGRNVEQFVLNNIVGAARRRGLSRIVGEYLPTPKNGMVKDHYSKLGFAPFESNRWVLPVAEFRDFPVHIEHSNLDIAPASP